MDKSKVVEWTESSMKSSPDYVKYDPNRPQPMKDTTHPSETTLAVTMIVKDETRVIKRLFDTVAPWLDYWVIHDTGSTDGTQKLILDYFTEQNIPGELHHTPWKNFGYNRSEAIKSTQNKADFTLLLDADFVLNVKDPNFKNILGQLGGHGHLIKYEGGMDYRQNLLVKTSLNWYYKGVTHEFITAPDCDNRKMIRNFDAITITHRADGANRSDKFERDIRMLEDDVKDDPDNHEKGRSYFYLGQSYKDLGATMKNKYDFLIRNVLGLEKKLNSPEELTGLTEVQVEKLQEKLDEMKQELPEEGKWNEYFGKSIEAYLKRARMGGWGEEVYYSYYQVGLARMRKGEDIWGYLPDLLHAFISRPVRLESLHHLIRSCRLSGLSHLGYYLGRMGEKNLYPGDFLFIDKGIHEWGFWDELSLCAHNCEDYELAYRLAKRVVDEKKYSSRDQPRMARNFSVMKAIYDKKQPAKSIATPIPPLKLTKTIIKSDDKSENKEEPLSDHERLQEYQTYLERGMTKMNKGANFWEFMSDLLRAFLIRPTRLEALYHLIRYSRLKGFSHLGYHLGRMADHRFDNPIPDDEVYDEPIHQWGFLDEMSLCANKYGDHTLAHNLGQKILNERLYPSREHERLTRNIEYYRTMYEKLQVTINNDKSLDKSASTIKDLTTNDVVIDDSVPYSNEPIKSLGAVKLPESYEFIRIQPEQKSNRLALIITNYNMNERADALGEYVKQHVKYPTDVILVDNGSDQQPPSKYTALHLGRNVQTTHGWLMGLHYADSLELFENCQYLAYGFVITSTEILPDQGDILTKLLQPMISDQDVVGIHPALSEDSTTWWKHLIQRTNNQDPDGWRYTNMIDNIFSLYRADWFNQMGRFHPDLTYAWGIDMETSYLARRDAKKILINDQILIRKITNIGYKMDRMKMSSDERQKNATEQINRYFTAKYGEKHNDIISRKHRIQEFLPVNLTLTQLTDTFGQKEGGHRLLMEYIIKHQIEFNSKFDRIDDQQINLLEIGCTREEWSHLNSSYKLAILAKEYGYHFWTIDVDTEAMNNVKRMVSYPGHFHPMNQRAEDFLESDEYHQKVKRVHFVYLDGFDVSLSESHHSPERKQKYQTYLQTDILNEKAYQMHLDCVHLLNQKIPVGGLICINDIISQQDYQQKGKTAVPYLLRTGNYRVVDRKYNAILLEKTNDSTLSKQIQPVSEPKRNYIVTLLGYTLEKPKHTNWYPWNRFLDVYRTMGYDAEWCGIDSLTGRISETNPKPRIFICWNQPTCVELIRSGVVHHNDVIIQKLTSLGKGMEGVNWGDDPKEYFKKWHWPIYQTVEYLLDIGFNIYAFGCQTHSEDFPEKKRIVNKLEKADRLFWINWGSTVFNYEEIQNCKPVTDDFSFDLGYVGSKWGRVGRGNLDQWDKFVQPVINDKPDLKCAFYGSGFPEGMISDEQAKVVLQKSKVCPIIHAPSWVAEQGIQDRFYTVFTAGRFGVVDNPGIYDFFTPDEVVCETDPDKYVERTKYFLEHPEEQIPYIEKVQAKIRTKYNLYTQWDNILTQILQMSSQQIINSSQSDSSYEFLKRVSQLHSLSGPFYQQALLSNNSK